MVVICYIYSACLNCIYIYIYIKERALTYKKTYFCYRYGSRLGVILSLGRLVLFIYQLSLPDYVHGISLQGCCHSMFHHHSRVAVVPMTPTLPVNTTVHLYIGDNKQLDDNHGFITLVSESF